MCSNGCRQIREEVFCDKMSFDVNFYIFTESRAASERTLAIVYRRVTYALPCNYREDVILSAHARTRTHICARARVCVIFVCRVFLTLFSLLTASVIYQEYINQTSLETLLNTYSAACVYDSDNRTIFKKKRINL